jgi:serine protease AprX
MKSNQGIKIALFLWMVNVVFAGPKLAKDLPPSNSTAPVDIIVQFKTQPSQVDLNQLGAYGAVNKISDAIKAFHATISPSGLAALEANPNVVYVSPNRTHQRFLDLTTSAVGANVAWQLGWDGAGVGVAVIDSGITLKDDFLTPINRASRVVYNESFTGRGNDATDHYGHGMHVAGIIGGNGTDSTGPAFSRTFKGVAPNVTFINLQVLDENGLGQESAVISAIQRAITLKNTYNIRVINLSLGRPVFESYKLDPLCQAVEAAWKAGIVVVVAAGNYGRDNSLNTNGYATISSPANDPYVITVGAGYLNIAAALMNHDLTTMPALSPTVARNPLTGTIGILRDFSIAWGDSMVWGDTALFGSTVFSHAAVGRLHGLGRFHNGRLLYGLGRFSIEQRFPAAACS